MTVLSLSSSIITVDPPLAPTQNNEYLVIPYWRWSIARTGQQMVFSEYSGPEFFNFFFLNKLLYKISKLQ